MRGAVRLRGLAELPVSIDHLAIKAAIAPFDSGCDERRWRILVKRRRNAAIRRAFSRLVGAPGRSARRDGTAIRDEYEEAWSRGYDRYDPERADLNPAPWVWLDEHLLLDPAAAARMRSLLLGAVLDELKPANVLEVGSGNGINLLGLAGAFPQTRFTGIELTAAGVAAARRLQDSPELPQSLDRYLVLPQRDRKAFHDIEFVRGSAAALPFPDSSFDLVLTVLAVEQMERIRRRALREIARVARRHVLMLEPFRELNRSPLRRLYVFSRDYFRGSIEDLSDFGLEPLWATADFPQEAFLGTALALSRKATA